MKPHPFDSFAQLLARGISRRDLLRLSAALGGGAAGHSLWPTLRIAGARARLQQSPDEPAPPGYWPPDFPLDPPGQVIDDYVDCLAAGHTPEECDKGFPWCEIREYLLNRAFPNLTGVVETLNPFGEDCGTTDCLQCCYVPSSNGCHSSFIGEDVINCNPRTYGAGTRGVGLTLLLQEPPPDGTCLFTPQVCTHVAMCVQGTGAGAATLAGGGAPAQLAQEDYLADPRALRQRARVFAGYVLAQARAYLNEFATDSPDGPSLQALNEALLGRGWATWRQDLAGLTFDLSDPLFRVADGNGDLIESASRANVGRTLALARLLTGLPNLAGRLAHVESRFWPDAEKAAYLAAVPDPDAALEASLDPHLINILKRVPSLQDYQLLAAPLPGESAADTYGGMPLGQPPELRLAATVTGLGVTLTATLEQPAGTATLECPLAVDWGDGRVSHGAFAVGQAALSLTHSYASAGRYAIYGVAANDSGLRGAACAVVELAGELAGTPAPGQVKTGPMICARAGVSGLSVLNLPFTQELRLALSFADAAGLRFLAGRSRIAEGPTNITFPVDLGDAYAHNPSRREVVLLSVEPRHGLSGPVARRTAALTLAGLTVGVYSTARMGVVDAAVPVTPEMLAVFVEGGAAPLPAAALTVNANGSITVPLLHQEAATGTWQRVERIEVAIDPAMLEGVALGATALPAGKTAAWGELRPGAFTRLPDPPPPPQEGEQGHRVFLPGVQR